MSLLITSDLHLDSNPDHEYRFDFLDFLLEYISEERIDSLIICGDFTDKKDNHESKLVNRIIEKLVEFEDLCSVYILAGNHDGLTTDSAYFRFLNHGFTGIHFYTKPYDIYIDNKISVLFLPHTRNPKEDWKYTELTGYDFIFMHQTITGARSSNGYEMEGLDMKFIKENMEAKYIISGDIHVPQKVGPVIYCGSPYHTRFADNFDPRFLVYKDGKLKGISYNLAPRKVKIILNDMDELFESDLEEGDMLKVDLRLKRSEFVNKSEYEKEIKEYCEENGIVLKGIRVIGTDPKLSKDEPDLGKLTLSKENLFERFCGNQKLDKYRIKVGEELMP